MIKKKKKEISLRERIRQKLISPASRMSWAASVQIFGETKKIDEVEEDDIDKACRETEEHFDYLFSKRQEL